MSPRNPHTTRQWLHTARTLTEALPYLKRHSGKTFVIKYGGHAMGDPELSATFARDVVLLQQVGIHPVVIHGGGPQIGDMLARLKLKTEFVDGLRVTDAATVEIVEMVLSGAINKQIVSAINTAGGRAIGLSGKDGALITARKLTRHKRDKDSNIEKVLDLGFVGEPDHIDPKILNSMEESGLIPVIAPIGFSQDGQTYNINADTVAGAIASALKATRLLLLTDVAGVLDAQGELLPDLTLAQLQSLMRDGTISGGMIPKLETCRHAVESGVEAAVILDGRIPHAMLLEIFTERGLGTLVRRSP